jgi:hypothetical protein
MSLIQIAVLGVVGTIVIACLLYFWIDLWSVKKEIDIKSALEEKQRPVSSRSRKKPGITPKKIEKKKNKLRVVK